MIPFGFSTNPMAIRGNERKRVFPARSRATDSDRPGPPRGTGNSNMKNPTREQRRHTCTRKRRYRTQGDALDAALLAGVERLRIAYHCPICGQWHLATKPARGH